MIEGTYLALEYMSTKNGGKGGIVINTASLGGSPPLSLSSNLYHVCSFICLGIDPGPSAPVYCATKHGVVGFTKSLKGRATSDGVRVNALCPDFVDTKMVRDGLDDMDEKAKAWILSRMLR